MHKKVRAVLARISLRNSAFQLEKYNAAYHKTKSEKFGPIKGYFLASHKSEVIDYGGNQKLRDEDHAEESETAPQGGMELTQSVMDEKKEKKAGHKSAYKTPYNTGGVK